MASKRPRVDSARPYEVYAIIGAENHVVYVGQGKRGRADQHLFPSRYRRLGLDERPTIRLKTVTTRALALITEARWIKRLKPQLNKARFGNTGGLKPWNYGLNEDPRCRGGHPKGVPLTGAAKKLLSIAMMGKATSWMIGRPPWNKGLTKDDHQGLRRISINMKGNFKGYRR